MNKISRYFVATTADGRTVGWECRTREVAELFALKRFGHPYGRPVTVRELSVVEWRRWKETQ